MCHSGIYRGIWTTATYAMLHEAPLLPLGPATMDIFYTPLNKAVCPIT